MSKDTDFDSNKKVDSPLNQEKQLTANQRLERIENSLIYSNQNSGSFANYESDKDEIDLLHLISVVWQGKYKVIAVSALFAITSILYALSLPNIYTSTLKLVPTNQESEGGLSSLASKYGGLASMAGINLAGGEGNNILHAVELMNSWPYLESFLEKNNLKASFMAVEGWSSNDKKLLYNEELYDKETESWKEVGSLFSDKIKSAEPSSFSTYQKIKKDFISVSFDEELGLFEISVSHYSPSFAYEVTGKLKDSVNEYFRNKDRESALASIIFLEQKINSTSNSQMREVFYNMIESHTQKMMLTEVNSEYLLSTLIPAKISETQHKSKPKRSLIVLVATLLGGLIGVFSVLVGNFVRTQDAK